MKDNTTAELSMLGKRAAHLGGVDFAQRQRQIAFQRQQLEENVKRSLRASEAADGDVQVLERRLAGQRKAATPDQLAYAARHRERVVALADAQTALAKAPPQELPKHREVVNRLRTLIAEDHDAGRVSRSGMTSDYRFVQELLWLENELANKREMLAKLVARTKAALDFAQERFRQLDEELAEAESAPFFANGGDK